MEASARTMDDAGRKLPDGTYIELVRSIYLTLLPTTIMTFAFVGVGVLIGRQTPDTLLAGLTIIGGVASAARVSLVGIGGRWAADEDLDLARARRLERWFACTYLTFAGVLGIFAARAFVVTAPEAHALVIALVSGYGAGVAAGLSLRPWISVPSILAGICPTIVAALLSPRPIDRATGLMLALFLAGGIHSMLRRYRSEAGKITMRRLFSTLARHDDLTGLDNRLSLRERFDELAGAASANDMLAVHCLDLNRFKPVNDRWGHPVGDRVLKAVSDRLSHILRRGDVAARVGGDEFVVLQSRVGHAGEAEMLARRIVREIERPYSIDGHEIVIGVSVGYALSSDAGLNLEQLIACADDALFRIKRSGGSVASCRIPPADRLTA